MAKLRLFAVFVVALSSAACERSTGTQGAKVTPESTTGTPLAADVGLNGGLDGLIGEKFRQAHVVGLEAIIVKHGRIVYQKGFGYADLATNTPVTGDTVFRVASVSKTFTLTALLRLMEQGKFRLDDDINKVLPFPIRHPRYPDQPITYRMLLTHSAGIADNDQVLDPLWNWQGDAQTSLAELIAAYFAPEGRFFAPANFLTAAPGTVSSYSNMGIALVGYLVQLLAARPFVDVVQSEVTLPLHLDTAAWAIPATAPPGGTATPYVWNEDSGQFDPLAQYGYPDVPSGMLRLSGTQLARFVMMYAGGGAIEGTRLLQPETIAEAQRLQVPALNPEQALLLHYFTPSPKGPTFIGHDGVDVGVASEMYWAIGDSNGLGIMLLANTEVETNTEQEADAFYDLLPLLAEWGQRL